MCRQDLISILLVIRAKGGRGWQSDSLGYVSGHGSTILGAMFTDLFDILVAWSW